MLNLFVIGSTRSLLTSTVSANEEYDSSDDYESGEDQDCPCQNNGLCALGGTDFCICPNGFTGRYCEISIEQAQGCGHVLEGESEYFSCAMCSCKNSILSCVAIETPACKLKNKNENIIKLKGIELSILVEVVRYIELEAYKYYIQTYKSRYQYEIVYQDIDKIDKSQNDTSIDKESNNSLFGDKKLVVFRSDNKIIGLFIGKDSSVINTNAANSIEINIFNLILLYSIYLVIKFVNF